MARGRRKGQGKAGVWGLSPFTFAVLICFILLVLTLGFLLGEVYLFVRNPRGEVMVPDLTGMNFSLAEATVSKAKLNIRVKDVIFSDVVKKDYVISQEPTTGVRVKEGRTIYLSVSKGKRDIEVPNLLGMHIDEANLKLKNLGLEADAPQMRYSDKAARGRIINQSPPPGAMAARGERIRTIVSKGPEIRNVEVPDVKGLRLDEALLILDQSGFRVSRITRIYSASTRGEKITGQAPEPGRYLKRGSEVILTLTLPAYKRKLGERQFRVVVNVPASDMGIEISIVKNDHNETKEIYKEVIRGPARVEKLVDAYGSTTISIYFDGDLYREETF